MANFYLVPTGADAGINGVALGLVRVCEKAGIPVSFFKPISQMLDDALSVDPSTHFARELFRFNPPEPVSIDDVEGILSAGGLDELVERVVADFSSSPRPEGETVIIEGLTPDSDGFDVQELNRAIASNLDADVVFVVNCQGQSAKQVADKLNMRARELKIPAFGYVLTQVAPDESVERFSQAVADGLKGAAANLLLLGAAPASEGMQGRTLSEVARKLNAAVLAGQDKLRDARAQSVVVASGSASSLADEFKAGALVLTPGDREDVLMAACLAHLRGIPLAGLVLTDGIKPTEPCSYLIEPLMGGALPVLLTQAGSVEAAKALGLENGAVAADDCGMMDSLVGYLAKNFDCGSLLRDRASRPRSGRMGPAAFRFNVIEKARKANKTVVLPEGAEPRTIRAAIICSQKRIARCVLLAKPEEVKEQADKLGASLPDDLRIMDPDELRAKYAPPLVELRKHKGMTPAEAEKYLQDSVVLGTMMLAQGDVDGLVSGAVHTTANTIRPALQLIKTAPGSSLVSSCFFMLMPTQVYVYADCAVNPNPTAQQLADIAIQSADSALAFGVDPKVAMISYSTGASGMGEDVEKVKEATRLAKEKRPDLLIDGPLQYDAASVPSVGAQKAPGSPVAGQATVFVFPDLNTGNTTYKAVQRSANVLSVGPMLQGLNKPVNDLSRGALVDDIVYTIALTAIQAESMERQRK